MKPALASSFTNRAVPGDMRRAHFARPFTNRAVPGDT